MDDSTLKQILSQLSQKINSLEEELNGQGLLLINFNEENRKLKDDVELLTTNNNDKTNQIAILFDEIDGLKKDMNKIQLRDLINDVQDTLVDHMRRTTKIEDYDPITDYQKINLFYKGTNLKYVYRGLQFLKKIGNKIAHSYSTISTLVKELYSLSDNYKPKDYYEVINMKNLKYILVN